MLVLTADGVHARHARDAAQQFLEEEGATRGIRVFPLRKRHAQRQHSFGLEAEGDAGYGDDAS